MEKEKESKDNTIFLCSLSSSHKSISVVCGTPYLWNALKIKR